MKLHYERHGRLPEAERLVFAENEYLWTPHPDDTLLRGILQESVKLPCDLSFVLNIYYGAHG